MAEANDYKDSLPEFYRGKSILVTGASGLMGKVLVEKLLYSCSDLKEIFILVRPKRGKSVDQRMDEMHKLPMFSRIRKEKPHVLKKLTAFQGDVTLEGLGLTEEARKRLVAETSIVFHCAATLKLESNLRDAVEMNTSGTWRVIEICKQMKNLQALIHLSTAFCHVDKDVLEEKAYEAPYDPKDIMRLVQFMDLKTLDKVTPELIAPHPNTYTFSKRLAERLVADQFPDMPVCIARPSIVTPSYAEPCSGWVDNLNGPIGIMVAAGKGVLRTMYCKAEYTAECIPLDFAINALIGIAKRTAEEKKPKEIPVYNLTQGKEKVRTWGEVLEMGRTLTWEYPFDMMLWYPDGNIRSSLWMHKICAFFLHWLPAYFIDFMMFIFRQKRFMIHVQNKIHDGLEVLQYFTTHKWDFKNERFLNVRDSMSPADKKTFLIDFFIIDELEYLKLCFLGARQYCVKEPLENLPRARRVIRILYAVDRLTALLFYMLIAYFIISWSDTARYIFDAAGDNLKNVPFIRNFVPHQDMPIPRHS